MSDPYIGEIKIFAGNFAPRNWTFCDGQLLPITQNTALFSIVGTIYGGDGRTTFGVPNLQGRVAMHAGHGPGLTTRNAGQTGGAGTVTLTEHQLANHAHTLNASTAETDEEGTSDPAGATPGTMTNPDAAYGPDTDPLVAMADEALPAAGGGGAHNNLQPYQVINYIIALAGVFPTRN